MPPSWTSMVRPLMARVAPAIGTVATFDEHAGMGTVTTEDGRELFFHCTQISDGSRTIEVGAPVRFEVVPGRLGRWEAARVEKR
jgi:cold shock CspA family protein